MKCFYFMLFHLQFKDTTLGDFKQDTVQVKLLHEQQIAAGQTVAGKGCKKTGQETVGVWGSDQGLDQGSDVEVG